MVGGGGGIVPTIGGDIIGGTIGITVCEVDDAWVWDGLDVAGGDG